MKILVVDDNEQILNFLRRVLEVCGCEKIYEALNGKQALALAREHKPHLIIMDIEMPVMNGIDAVRILKAESDTSGIPVVAFTSMEGTKEMFLKQGFDDYIPKATTNLKVLMDMVKGYAPN